MVKLFKYTLAAILVIATQACSPLKSGMTTSASTTDGKSSGLGQAPATKNATLSWAATPGQQVGFKIEMSVDGGAFALQKTVPDTNTTVIPNLATGKTYQFRIRAYNLAGESNNTAVVTYKN